MCSWPCSFFLNQQFCGKKENNRGARVSDDCNPARWRWSLVRPLTSSLPSVLVYLWVSPTVYNLIAYLHRCFSIKIIITCCNLCNKPPPTTFVSVRTGGKKLQWPSLHYNWSRNIEAKVFANLLCHTETTKFNWWNSRSNDFLSSSCVFSERIRFVQSSPVTCMTLRPSLHHFVFYRPVVCVCTIHPLWQIYIFSLYSLQCVCVCFHLLFPCVRGGQRDERKVNDF